MNSPESKTIKQLQTDLIYLAKRSKILEGAIIRLEDALLAYAKESSEWSEFLNKEMFRQFCIIHKNKKSFVWFRSSLKETHRQTYEKFESLFHKIDLLYKKKNRGLAVE